MRDERTSLLQYPPVYIHYATAVQRPLPNKARKKPVCFAAPRRAALSRQIFFLISFIKARMLLFDILLDRRVMPKTRRGINSIRSRIDLSTFIVLIYNALCLIAFVRANILHLNLFGSFLCTSINNGLRLRVSL